MSTTEPAWGYAEIADEQVRETIGRNLASVIVFEAGSLQPVIVGLAFVIGVFRRYAMCLTAEHVAAGAVRRAHAANRHRTNALDNSITQAMYRRALDTDRIAVVLSDERQSRQGRIVTGWSSPETDLAVLLVEFPDDFGSPGPAIIPIDSDPCEPGTRVIAVGYDNPEVLELGRSGGITVYGATFPFYPMAGRITERMSRGRVIGCPTYVASIPFHFGMSGGPVLRAPTAPGDPLAAIGVVSHAFEGLPGETAMGSGVVPALMAYAALVPNGDAPDEEFLRLRELGVIRDVGRRAAEILVNRDAADPGTCTVGRRTAGD